MASKRRPPTARTIQIRTAASGLDPLDRPMSWLTFYVEHESAAAVHISNRVPGPLHTSCTLVRLPNGNLANSAGQEFEVRGLDTLVTKTEGQI